MSYPSSTFRDISLTFAANPVTGDVIILTDEIDIQASVVNLVLTMNYEIPFHPEQGCAVYSSLFENMSPMTAVNIRRSIIDVLQNFEPRITVLTVEVSPDPAADGYGALITYQIVGQTRAVTVSMFLKKTR